MEEFYYLLLGALLAVLGSFMAQRFENHLAQLKDEQLVLADIAELLLDYNSVKGKDWKRDEILPDGTPETNNFEEASILFKLTRRPLRITTKKNRKLAVKVTKFGLDIIFRTRKNLDSLTNEIHEAMNQPLISEYHNQINTVKKRINKILQENQAVPNELDELTKL